MTPPTPQQHLPMGLETVRCRLCFFEAWMGGNRLHHAGSIGQLDLSAYGENRVNPPVTDLEILLVRILEVPGEGVGLNQHD
jgi:hypothetical protein